MKTPRHQRPTALKEFLFGAPYYPEHWTAEDMAHDADRMAAAGVNVVRMAEFAWDLMEPSRGKFDFSLFDKTIAHLAKRGIRSILCTPTAAPPLWLTKDKPAWMRRDIHDFPMVHGSRQHCCTNHPGFQKESVRITRAMAAHFKKNPHVIGWQTDNEFFCHKSECYCPACLAVFQSWLKKKYGTIAALNKAWGTAFWAQTYERFQDIRFPYPDRPTHANPGQQLDYNRFLSFGITVFQSQQIRELRKANPSWWISHNGMFNHIDHWTFAEELDFYGVDVYPGFSCNPAKNEEVDPVWASLRHEECRAASGNFVVFEQQGGAGGQHPYLHATPRPGQMRLWAWQAVAHGADGVLHFRWRSCRFGAEIYWNGILDHDNITRRRYDEFALEGKEFGRLGPLLLGTATSVKAAILVQTDQDEAHNSLPMGLPGPWEQRKHLLRELQKSHLACGVVDASDSFEGLEVIFMPGFVLMDEDLAGRLETFVKKGGVLLATARTATRNRDNQVLATTPPGWLLNVFGSTVEESGAHDPITFNLAKERIPADSFFEILKPSRDSGVKIIASWNQLEDGDPHAAPGTPAITLNAYGKGTAVYIGTCFGAANTASLVAALLPYTRLRRLAKAPAGVEITCREGNGKSLLFILNHEGKKRRVSGLGKGLELISGKKIKDTITLEPYAVAILQKNKGSSHHKI